MIVGIGFYAILTATIAATFVGQESQSKDRVLQGEMTDVAERLERIERALLELRISGSTHATEPDP